MSTKWNRELVIKEAATEIREVSSCNIDLAGVYCEWGYEGEQQ